MSPTTFRKGAELLKDAGSDQEYLALLQISNKKPFGKIYVTNGALESYARSFFDLISTTRTNEWIRQTIHQINGVVDTSPCEAPRRLEVPRLRISSALANPLEITTEEGEIVDIAAQLVYVIVVEGQSGAGCSKVAWKHNLTEIAREMFDNVVNGYSVVFSAAMMMKDYQRLRHRRQGQQVFLSTVNSFPALLNHTEANESANSDADQYSHLRDRDSTWTVGMGQDFHLGIFC